VHLLPFFRSIGGGVGDGFFTGEGVSFFGGYDGYNFFIIGVGIPKIACVVVSCLMCFCWITIVIVAISNNNIITVPTSGIIFSFSRLRVFLLLPDDMVSKLYIFSVAGKKSFVKD
jgi:hypothetical protein